MRIPSRQDDEMLLAWLRLRGEGLSSAQVAMIYGVTPERVRTATQRVSIHDIVMDGARAARAYPWRREMA